TRVAFLTLLACAVLVRLGPAQENSNVQQPVTLFMAGDSTMATQAVALASSGQSSKSFRDKGRWKQILDRLKPGDFVIIQFGHNDSKPDEERHTEPFGSFKENLERFVKEVRECKATPLLATSI